MLSSIIAAIQLACAIILSGILLIAALHKIRDRAAFKQVLSGYQLLPTAWHGVAVWLLILLEFLAGCLLLSPNWLVTGALLAVALMVLYAAVISITLLRGLKLQDCGCSGAAQTQQVSAGLLLRNLILICLGLMVVLGEPKYQAATLMNAAPFSVFMLITYLNSGLIMINKSKLENLRAYRG